MEADLAHAEFGTPKVGERVSYRGAAGTVVRVGESDLAIGDRRWAVIAFDAEPGEVQRLVWVGDSGWHELRSL